MNTFRLFVLFLTIISFCPAFGQKDRNVIYKVGVGELIYTPPSEGNPNAAVKVLKDVADVLLSGQTTKQQPQYAEAVRASIVNGLSKVILYPAVRWRDSSRRALKQYSGTLCRWNHSQYQHRFQNGDR